MVWRCGGVVVWWCGGVVVYNDGNIGTLAVRKGKKDNWVLAPQ